MKKVSFILLFLLVFFLGCSDNTDSNFKLSKKDIKDMDKTLDRITKDSILVDFIDNISNQEYEKASLFIHPKLMTVWTNKRFKQDWKEIRHAVKTWAPEVTSTFSGKSQQGPYEQVTYKIDSPWNSLSSIDLISMKSEGSEYIVRIHIRAPYLNETPKSVEEVIDQFVQLLFSGQYQEISNLLSQNCKSQFPAESIKRLKPILGKNKSKIEKRYYRMCANTVWYDAVRLNVQDDVFTFMELILSTKNQKTKIETLTFRGAMK